MHTILVSEKYYFSDEDMENIVVTALEDGIGYWACLDNSDVEPRDWGDWTKKPKDMPTSVYAWKIIQSGGTLHFLDAEDETAEYYFSLVNLYTGISMAIGSGMWDGDIDILDSSVADAIFQYGLFGKLVYS